MAQTLESELDATVAKLNKTLRYWQTWEAEYEGFKEELEAEEPEPSSQRMIEIADEFGSSIINESEIKSMVSFDKPPIRNRAQVINIIKDRMSSARRNAETIQKQIDRKETQSITTKNDTKPQNSELMEVTEELDEDGNVVSSKLENFDKAVDEMTEVLKNHSVAGPKKSQAETPKAILKDDPDTTVSVNGHAPVTTLALGKPTILAPGVDENLEVLATDEEILLPAGDHDIAQDIRSSLNDLGPIVAELDLEEDEYTDREWDEDEDLEENEYGMTNIRDQMDEDYILEMEALAKKHGMRNLGKDPANVPGMPPKSVLSTKSGISSNSGKAPPSSLSSTGVEKPKKNKGVRFSESLDISPYPETIANPSKSKVRQEETREFSGPLGDVVEKSFTAVQPILAANPAKKVSRFKSAKMAESGEKKTGSDLQGGLNAENHDAISTPRTDQHLGDDLDSMKEEFGLYSKRMATQDHQPDMSVFNQDNEEGEDGVVHESSQKISRFKAARLGL